MLTIIFPLFFKFILFQFVTTFGSLFCACIYLFIPRPIILNSIQLMSGFICFWRTYCPAFSPILFDSNCLFLARSCIYLDTHSVLCLCFMNLCALYGSICLSRIYVSNILLFHKSSFLFFYFWLVCSKKLLLFLLLFQSFILFWIMRIVCNTTIKMKYIIII